MLSRNSSRTLLEPFCLSFCFVFENPYQYQLDSLFVHLVHLVHFSRTPLSGVAVFARFRLPVVCFFFIFVGAFTSTVRLQIVFHIKYPCYCSGNVCDVNWKTMLHTNWRFVSLSKLSV